MTGPAQRRDGLSVSAIAVLVLAFALRLVLLDADPQYDAWSGHYTDEGRWVENARSFVLEGKFVSYPRNLHLMLAPLYQALNVPVLAIFGVSVGTARLVTAFCGSLLLLVAAWWLGRRVRSDALLLGLALLALQPDLLMLSRMAIPEVPAMLAETVVALLLIRGVREPRKYVAAGIAVLVGVGLKSTMALIAGGLVLLPLFLPAGDARRGLVPRPLKRRLADTVLYAATFAGPLALVGGIALWRGMGPAGENWYLPDVEPGAGLYALAKIPFEGLIAPTLVPWLLGAWLATLSLVGSGKHGPDLVERRRIAGVALWLVATLVPALFSSYFPHRYQVHALVPLAFLAALGVDAYLRRGGEAIDARLAGKTGAARLAVSFLLSLPAAVLAAPVVMPLVASVGNDPSRLRSKVAALAVASLALTPLAAWLARRMPVAAPAVRLPVFAAIVWLWLGAGSSQALFWSSAASGAPTSSWATLALLAAGITTLSLVAERLLPAYCLLVERRGVAIVAAFWIVASLVTVSPNFLTPKFTARNVSEDLGKLLKDATSVTSHKAETLFNGNAIRYRSEYRIDPLKERAEYFVSLKGDQLWHGFVKMLDRDYELVRKYRLYLSPEGEAIYRERRGSAEGVSTVTVHRLKSAGPVGIPAPATGRGDD